jgi:hypothetical protein
MVVPEGRPVSLTSLGATTGNSDASPPSQTKTFVRRPVLPNQTIIMNAATIPGRLIGKEMSVTSSPSPGRSYFSRAWAMTTPSATLATVVTAPNHSEFQITSP